MFTLKAAHFLVGIKLCILSNLKQGPLQQDKQCPKLHYAYFLKQFNTKCAALSASNCLKLAICVIMLLKHVAIYFMLESNQKVCWFKCEQCTEAASKGLANHKPLKHSHLEGHTFLGGLVG